MLFVQAWLDASNVVVGTKCNSLLRLNVDSGEFEAIGLHDEADSALDSAPTRGHPCGIHAVALNPSRTLLATGAPDSSQCAVLETDGFCRKQVFQVNENLTPDSQVAWICGVSQMMPWMVDLCSMGRNLWRLFYLPDATRGKLGCT